MEQIKSNVQIDNINLDTGKGSNKGGNLNVPNSKTEMVSLNTNSSEPIKISVDDISDGKIAKSASDALNGNFVNANKDFLSSGELTYTKRDDGTVLIKRNGEAMGFTLLESIKTNIDKQDNPSVTEKQVEQDADEPFEYGTKINLDDIVDLNKISKSPKDVNWHTYFKIPMTDWKMANLSYEINGDIVTIMDNGIVIGYTNKSNLSMFKNEVDEDIKLNNSNDSLNSILHDVDKLRNFVGPLNPNSELKYIYTLNSIEKYRYGDYINIYKNGDKTTITYNMYDENGRKIEKGIDNLMNEKISDYVDLKNITNIKDNNGSIDVSFKDGSTVHLINGKNSYVYGTDNNGNMNFGYYVNNNELESINLFSDYTNNNYQFGGRQGDYSRNSAELISDPKIVEILEKYFPGTNLTEKQSFLNNIAGKACGYVGKINGLFNQYVGKEKEFREKFGFDMYKIDSAGNIDFNYEYMVLNFIGYVYSEKHNKNIYQTQRMVAHSITEGKMFENFISEKYNIDCKVSTYMGGKIKDQNNSFGGYAGKLGHVYGTSNIASTCKELLKNNDDVMVGVHNYTLVDYENGTVYHNNGGHAMTVIGVENGTLIVSSFGRKQKLSSADYSVIYMTNYDLEV